MFRDRRFVVFLLVLASLTACGGASPAALPAPTVPPPPTATLSPTPAAPDSPSTTPLPTGPTVEVPAGIPPTLDGTLSPEEWAGAQRIDLDDRRELFLMHDGAYLYLGIRATVTSIGSVCIERGDEISILHASAALATAVYRPAGAGWQRVQGFGTWYCRAVDDSPEAQTERSEHLQQFGWLASNVHRGTPNEMEYQIALSEEPMRLAVTYLEDHTSGPQFIWWPAGLEDGCLTPQLIQGRSATDMSFSPETWASIVAAASENAGLPPSAPASGDTWTRPTDGMVTVFVPGGEFAMGSSGEEVALALGMCEAYYIGPCQSPWFEVEQPTHTVTLDSFWIDQTEVSNAQYRRCVEAGGCDPPAQNGSDTRASYYNDARYDDYPVVHVDWYQADAYCRWAEARLPSEAEWEYAARGAEGRRYPWGENYDGARLNSCDTHCAYEWADESYDDGYADTAPVGSYPEGASWCGVLDLAGNVWEWTADWFADYAGGRQTNPTGPSSGTARAVRGDAADGTRAVSRPAARHGMSPSRTYSYTGFRCARSDSP